MAYDKTIPLQTNQVRGASGDLIKIKNNFVQLAPVAISGIHGLISGGEAAASGQVPVSQGAGGSDFYYRMLNLPNLDGVTIAAPASGQALTYDGSGWVNATPVSALSGLSDTVIAAPASGQALTWNGSAWVNDTPVTSLSGLSDTAVGGAVSGEFLAYDGANWIPSGAVDRACAAVRLLVDQDITAGGFVTVTGFEDTVANAAFSNHVSGIKIENGVSKVDVRVNALFDTAVGIIHRTRIQKNGVPLGDDASYGVDAQVAQRIGAASADPAVNVMAIGIPVVSGDVISFGVEFDSGTQTVASGQTTNIIIQDNAQAPGGAGGGTSTAPKTIIATMTSGGTFEIANVTATICSGVTVAKINDGGFTLNSGTVTVPATSGYTHVRITGNVGYDTHATGYREATIWHNGTNGIKDPVDPAIVIGSFSNRSAANPTAGAISVMQVVTPLIPISGGDTFELVAGQGSGGPLDTIGGAAVQGAITSITIEAYTLT